MIVTVLGGSSQSTPVLVDALAAAMPECPITIRLAGRNLDHLAAVKRACDLLGAGAQIATEIFDQASWAEGLPGSDVVLIQPRIGGFSGREFDENFPLAFGGPGDEGRGPGGLSAAFRGWPSMRGLFAQMLTSPASLLVRLAHLDFPGWPLVATCELPWTTLMQLRALTGRPVEPVSFGYTGVNHLGFLFAVHASEDLLALYTRVAPRDSFPAPELVRRLGAFPLKYLRLHFCRSAVVKEQSAQTTPRAQLLADLAAQAFGVFRSGDKAAIRRALALRPAPWYAHAVVPLLLAAMGRPVQHPVFLSAADEGGDVLERAYRAEEKRWIPMAESPCANGTVPAEAADLVERFRLYEGAAAEAVRTATTDALADALALHPWVRDGDERSLALTITGQPLLKLAEEERELCPS